MRRPNRSRRWIGAGVFVLAAVALAWTGCGRDGGPIPTAPVEAPVGPSDVSVESQTLHSAISVRKIINGNKGGVICNGRYRVTFAPGAFLGARTITLIDPRTPDMRCVLLPEGLHFDADVDLRINLQNTPLDQPSATIEWWDPLEADWVDMGATYCAAGHAVEVELEHFSCYRPRAGW